ncbi:HpcH/HpaI aldolase/citrate lyase family protein [Sphingomonas canadensis]|uniref:HpcH/HpaI aldolase/citrate lyase family protein n=1 Tax=Sphingomonas canadensis TaxID=1219257 RepID=A0ABW3H817_9SPHN|nr:CoA ester lyase [Sphingomonas canadensis]MCW3836737.1 CoA ester lyase [Sphingomonas canadensis]
MTTARLAPRTALFMPASNSRAIEKAHGLPADMVILDLEDAVREEDKERARDAARAAGPFAGRLFAIRINAEGSGHHREDLRAVAESRADYVVVPKVEAAGTLARVADAAGRPVLAMIETPAGVLAAPAIAAAADGGECAGLIAGTNDLAAQLRLPPSAGRASMGMALQAIVLAARAGGAWAIDGVFNRLDDPEALAAECAEGRMLGFDGKSLIHPNQIAIARAAYSPSEAELEEARALIAAATGGAERYRDAMIEDMHVAQARALIERAD